jgi:hypothetical protein
MWHGEVHSGKPVSSQMVERVLQQTAQILQHHGYHDPRRSIPSSKHLNPAFQKLIKQYKDSNPAVVGKLPLPDEALTFIYNCPASLHNQFSQELLHTIRDLIVLAVFFCL